MFITDIGTDIAKAKAFLEQGELVAIPTETVYGLAGNGLNPAVLSKIYSVKNRPQFNPLILHVGNKSQFSRWALSLPEQCTQLMDAFSPGPITFLLEKSIDVPDLLTAGSKRVALRIPDHPLTLELLSALNFPLAAPSANPSGYVSPVSALHVQQGLNGQIPYILDGGDCKVGLESTIVSFEDGAVIVHRLGGISEQQIRDVVREEIRFSLSHAHPEAPGQLKSHYATATPLIIENVHQVVTRSMGERIGVISFQKDYGDLVEVCKVLSPSGDLSEAAARLFSAMRELDAMGLDKLIAEQFPEEGLGRAINDRLQRAAFRNN